MNQTTQASPPSVASKVVTIFKLLASLEELGLRNNQKTYQLKSRLLGTPVDQCQESKDAEKPVGILNRMISLIDLTILKATETEKFLAEVLEQTDEPQST